MANHVSHAALPYPVKGCRFTIGVPYKDSYGDPTDPTTPDTERSIDAAAFSDCSEEVTTISGTGTGTGYLTLTGDEMNGSLIAVVAKVASGPKPTIATLYPRVLPVLNSGTAAAGAAGTITLASGAVAIDDYYNGCIVRTTGGTGGGGGSGSQGNQARVITGYVGSTKVATISPNWETTPSTDTTYEVLVTEMTLLSFSDTVAWKASAPDSLSSGKVPTDVKLWLTGTPDALSSGKVPTDIKLWLTGTPNALISGRVDANAQVVGDKTGYALSSAGVQAIWDALTSALTTASSIGKLLVDNINATLSSISAKLPAALTGGGNIKADALAVNGSTTAASRLGRTLLVVATGTVSGSPTSTVFAASDLPAGLDDDAFKDRTVIFDGNTTAGIQYEMRTIVAYDASAKEITVAAMTTTPQVGDTFVIV